MHRGDGAPKKWRWRWVVLRSLILAGAFGHLDYGQNFRSQIPNVGYLEPWVVLRFLKLAEAFGNLGARITGGPYEIRVKMEVVIFRLYFGV